MKLRDLEKIIRPHNVIITPPKRGGSHWIAVRGKVSVVVASSEGLKGEILPFYAKRVYKAFNIERNGN